MKRVQTFIFICISYFTLFLSTTNNSGGDKLSDIKMKKEIKQLEEEHKEIINQYKTDKTEAFIVKKDVIRKTRDFLKRVIDIAERKEDLQKNEELCKRVNTLIDWRKTLGKSYKEKTEYENFLKASSTELLKLAERQVVLYSKIENALQNFESQNSKSSCNEESAVLFKGEQKEEHSKMYRSFIARLREFLKGNSLLGEEADSLDDFVKKYNKHECSRNITQEQKAEEYIHLGAFWLLREKINVILQLIDFTKDSTFRQPAADLARSSVEDYLLEKARALEQEAYATDENLKSAADIFSSVEPFSKKEGCYKELKEAAEKREEIEKVREIIKNRYKKIAAVLVPLAKKKDSSDFTVPNDLSKKFDELIQYNDFVIDKVSATICSDVFNSTVYDDVKSAFTLPNSKKYSLSITSQEVDKNKVICWFGIEIPGSSALESTVGWTAFLIKRGLAMATNPVYKLFTQSSRDKWIESLQKGLDKNDAARKKALSTFDAVLNNINAMLITLHEAVSEKKTHLNIDQQIRYTGELSRALCCIVKITDLKNIARCNTPPYVQSTVSFIKKMKENKCRDYPALNIESYSSLKNISFLVFILREKKGHALLKYLHNLIQQCNEANGRISFLVDAYKEQEQNDLVKNLCSMIVEEKLNPMKSLPYTESMQKRIREEGGEMAETLEGITEIKNKAALYSLQKKVILFDKAVELLELYTQNTIKCVVDPFTAYRTENTLQKIKEMREKEKTEQIAESKRNVVSCETIVALAGKSALALLSEIGHVDLQPVADLSVSDYNFDSVSRSFAETTISTHSQDPDFISKSESPKPVPLQSKLPETPVLPPKLPEQAPLSFKLPEKHSLQKVKEKSTVSSYKKFFIGCTILSIGIASGAIYFFMKRSQFGI